MQVNAARSATSVTTQVLRSVKRDIRYYSQNKIKLSVWLDSFRRMVANIPKLFSSCILAQPIWRPMRIK